MHPVDILPSSYNRSVNPFTSGVSSGEHIFSDNFENNSLNEETFEKYLKKNC